MDAFTGSSLTLRLWIKKWRSVFFSLFLIIFIFILSDTNQFKMVVSILNVPVQLHGQEWEVDAQLHKTHAKSGNHFSVLPLYLPRLHHTQAPLGAAELEEDGHEGGVHQDPELLQGQLFQVMLNYFIFDFDFRYYTLKMAYSSKTFSQFSKFEVPVDWRGDWPACGCWGFCHQLVERKQGEGHHLWVWNKEAKVQSQLKDL